MRITVNISDEMAADAQARGLRPEDYVEEILAQRLEMDPTATRSPRTLKEIRTWLDSLAQFSDKIPPLPAAITREWIYQDHD